MKLELELWQFILLLLAFFGAAAGAGRLLLGQIKNQLDERFKTQEETRKSNYDQLARRLDDMDSSGREAANQWHRVELEMLKIKGDFPLQYVLRDDYIRGQSIIEAKLDGLAMKVENAQLRGVLHAQNNKGAHHAG